jgi:dienelactone hydrolase
MGTMVSYQDDSQTLEGYLALTSSATKLPGVLVVPTWLNVSESICVRADRLAALGYIVLVADLFGAGIRPKPPQLPQTVVASLLKYRLQFRQRLFAALKALQSRPECDFDRIAAIGYCLGGCGVLELARAGAPLQGVVSLHGILNTPLPAQPETVKAKILVLHGDADPLAPFDELATFREEMRAAQANWQVNIYGAARHSFTGEGILDQETTEAAFHPQSETLAFLEEVVR